MGRREQEREERWEAGEGPKDHLGRPLQGATKLAWVAKQVKDRSLDQLEQDDKDTARVLGMLAAKLYGMPAPDALRALAAQADNTDGRDAALGVLRQSGMDARAQAQAWRQQEPLPVQRQASRGVSWDSDPDHDKRVMAAISSGAPMEEVNRVRDLVAAERQAARVQTARQSDAMWRLRDGTELRDDTGGQPAPFQRSVIEHEWHKFPDHQPDGQPAPQVTAAPAAAEPSIWSER
jgi:hypothetical protein